MNVLADTNILLRWIDQDHPHHQVVYGAVQSLLERGDEMCIAVQNAVEFWNVSTRPIDRNGRGRTPSQTASELDRVETFFRVLPDDERTYIQWKRLVTDFSVSGVKVHDARLVAVMRVHGLSHILTFNTADFARYTEITAVHPHDALT